MGLRQAISEMKIAFIKFWDTANCGDRLCCPYDYFDFGKHECEVHDIFTFKQKIPIDMIIFGGGGMLHTQVDEIMRDISRRAKELNPYCKVLVWGVGSNYHHVCRGHWHDWLKDEFDIIALRDRASPFAYVPCPSCMHSEFAIHRPRPEEPFVIFYHEEDPINLPHPKMSNYETDNMKHILDFLAKGFVVLTNSFHGAYWSMLTQKPVIIINPFSGRFFAGLPWGGVYANEHNFVDQVGNAIVNVAPRLLLDDCKRRNQEFYQTVITHANDTTEPGMV
ncbi:MAG: hypothetical protein ACWGQW_02485 [bacterium]